MVRELGVTQARKDLARIIDEVRYKGENYIIVRHGQPAAAVVPIEVFRQWEKEREELFATIRRIQASNRGAEPDEVIQDVLEAQRAVRQSPC